MTEIGFPFYFFNESIKIHVNVFHVTSWISFLFRDKRLGQNQLKKQINRSPIRSLLPQEKSLTHFPNFLKKNHNRTSVVCKTRGKTLEREKKGFRQCSFFVFVWFHFGFVLFSMRILVFSCGNVLFNSPIYPLKNISIDYKVIQIHFSSAAYTFSFILLHLFRALEDFSWSREVP